MSLQQLFTSRKPYDPATFVAGAGKMFYDETSGYLRIGDGLTPGGHSIGLPQASTSTFGGVKLGPGVILNGENQIIIDSSGLSFNFGDFQATTPAGGAATLSSINTDQNIDIVSNGTGVINLVGDLHIHRTAGYDPADTNGAVFSIKSDGQIQMKVPLSDTIAGALEIIGNDTGLFLSPNQTGVILHVTGNSGLVSRNYFDANGNYALLAGRRYNGTQLAPTRVLNGELMLRIVAQGAAATGSGTAAFQTFGPARIEFVATEDQTPTAQGGEVRILATANGTTATGSGVIVATFNATTGVTASRFVGPLTGTATTATYAQSFNTSTLVATAVTAGYATTFNTSTLVATAVQAGTVTTAAQPAITSVGTLTSLTVTNLVTAKNYAGQTRDAGTLSGGGTLTIDFATDHNVLVNLTTTAVIGFVNTSSGKTVTVMVKNASGANRAVTLGVVAGNTSGGNASPNVNDGRTGVMVYRTFGTATTDIYCEFN